MPGLRTEDPATGGWRIELTAPAEHVDDFEAVLDPMCHAISCFVAEAGRAWKLEGYCETRPDAAALGRALAALAAKLGVPPPRVTIHSVAARDWVAETIQMFPPVSIGRYFIYGTHYDAAPPAGRIGICINAGPAFGTGEHASTSGCLMALDRLARRARYRNVLDVGCGSGILTLAAAKTWRARVMAVDVDARAAAVAAENAVLNRITQQVRVTAGDGARAPGVAAGAPYDLIVSNILCDPLCRMAPDLARCLSPGGTAVLGGFLRRDGRRVAAAQRLAGLSLRRRFVTDGWETLVLSG